MAKKKQAEQKAKETEVAVPMDMAAADSDKTVVLDLEINSFDEIKIKGILKSSQQDSDYSKHLKFAKFNLSQGAE